ncbi:MAG: hypothetical protein LBG88_02560 [Christensenellaceae bacterium]|nr:hypothetical protein [Christensenellaceae bacterium]
MQRIIENEDPIIRIQDAVDDCIMELKRKIVHFQGKLKKYDTDKLYATLDYAPQTVTRNGYSLSASVTFGIVLPGERREVPHSVSLSRKLSGVGFPHKINIYQIKDIENIVRSDMAGIKKNSGQYDIDALLKNASAKLFPQKDLSF